MQKECIVFLGLLLLSPLVSAVPIDVRVNLQDTVVHIHSDKTYQSMMSTDETLLTQRGIHQGQQAEETFFPKTQTLKLLEAYVIQPNGKKVLATQKNIFTRPSQASESAPGFTNSLTTTVVFPQLQQGSRTFVKWELTQVKPDPFGVNFVDGPDFHSAVVKQVFMVYAPNDLSLYWAQIGGYQISVKHNHKEQIIEATLKNKPAAEEENNMVSEVDVVPIFALSSMHTWQEIGKIYWQRSRTRVTVTPAVRALAKRIAGHEKGEQAAIALYNWVTQNIRYVAVYLNQAAGYVPHFSDDIIRNGYGDCKDHVNLLESLLEARGIASEPVLISAGGHYQSLPVPSVYEFNHVIIHLPKYRVYADPTIRTASFGDLNVGERGKFVVTANRDSRIIYLSPSSPVTNRYRIDNYISIQPDGTVKGQNRIQFFGYFNTLARQIVSMAASPKRIANQLLSRTPEGGTGNMITSNPEDLMHNMVVQGKWNSPYAIVMNHPLFFTTPMGVDFSSPHSLRQFISPGQRQYPIIVGAAAYYWHYLIKVPKGYRIAQLAPDVHFRNAAGQYDSHYKITQNRIDVMRTLTLNRDVYSVKAYPALVALLYQPINDARALLGMTKPSR